MAYELKFEIMMIVSHKKEFLVEDVILTGFVPKT